MLISHEVPKVLFNDSLEFNDYDYALVHMFDKDPEYLQFYKDCVAKGRHVLLDNSIFELGEAYDNESFAKWVEDLKPTEYIVPDALEDMEKTISQMDAWNRTYRNLPGKKIGVVQGKTPEEIVNCYVYLDKDAECDKIAFSFDYSLYSELAPHKNKYFSWMVGRSSMLYNMLEAGIINTNKPHHLLGCGLPQEFALYKGMDWIESIDTSNPIVHGIKGIKYDHYGLSSKESIKLVDLMDTKLDKQQLYDINHNISYFKNYAKS